MKLYIFLPLGSLVSFELEEIWSQTTFQAQYLSKHGPSGQHGKKPWLGYTKKYTGGKCAWDKTRTDCAICAKDACPVRIYLTLHAAYGYNFFRIVSCKRILFMTAQQYVFTKNLTTKFRRAQKSFKKFTAEDSCFMQSRNLC